MGSGNGVKKESCLCAALKTEKRVSTSPVRADHVSWGPRNSQKRVVFCKCFSNRFAERFFPDLGINFGACGAQNVIIRGVKNKQESSLGSQHAQAPLCKQKGRRIVSVSRSPPGQAPKMLDF